MPELPEVETMVRGIRSHVEGRRIRQIRQCRCRCRPITIRPTLRTLQARARGKVIESVYRFAKRVVLELNTGHRIAIEPRMTGLMLLTDPPSREHLRLEWVLETDREPVSLWFWDRRGLGTVTLYSEQEYVDDLLGDRFGPDALAMTIDDWQALSDRTSRPVKVVLLDQKLVAGIGNLYASEILHLSGVSPEQSTRTITTQQWERIAENTDQVLRTAIHYEGSTLGDGTYRNALNQDGSFQNEHRVYAREGQQCRSCSRGVIRRIVQAQRSTFYCPMCQRARRKRTRK